MSGVPELNPLVAKAQQSVFGLCSYILYSPKGRCYIPFSRGSCFPVAYETHSFYKHHVLSAGHVVSPHKFAHMYSRPDYVPPPGVDPNELIPEILKRIGDRHVSGKLLKYTEDGKRVAALDLHPAVKRVQGLDAAIYKIKKEESALKNFIDEVNERSAALKPQALQQQAETRAETEAGSLTVPSPPLPFSFQPLEVDRTPIQKGEKLTFLGYDCQEQEGEEDFFTLRPVAMDGAVVCRYSSPLYGRVLLCTSFGQQAKQAMSGGPVIRPSNGKVVGVMVSNVVTHAMLNKAVQTSDHMLHGILVNPDPLQARVVEPASASNELEEIRENGGIAFIPILELLGTMKRFEAD